MIGVFVLIGTIICSSLLTILFKYFDRYKVNTAQAIVVNYFTASSIAFFFSSQLPNPGDWITYDWCWSSLLLGFLFITLFNLLAITSQQVGVTEANVANKVTFIFPVLLGYFFFSEELTALKITGIFLAIAAVLVSASKSKDKKLQHAKKQSFLILLFLGGGVLDLTLSYTKAVWLNDDELSLYTGYSFLIAGIMGSIHLLIQRLRKGQKMENKSWIGGLTLGSVNYFSIVLFLGSLSYFTNGVVFPTVNMGVIIVSSLLSWLLFNEKLSRTKIVAILLACAAITLVSLP